MREPDAELDPTTSGTGRLEAFSDGVFAVAITLLVLNLAVPLNETSHLPLTHGLLQRLGDQGSSYLAYLLSFATVLIMWVNHHNLFRLIKRTDHAFLMLNGLLLLIITTFPFATNLLATYLTRPDERVAQVIYSALSLAMALTYNRMWAYAAHGRRLIERTADDHTVTTITKSYAVGPIAYAITVLIAFINAEVSLALCIALALFFALPSGLTHGLVVFGQRLLRIQH